MSEVVIFHPVGNADLALPPNANSHDIDTALEKLDHDPTELLNLRHDHTAATTGSLPGTVEALANLGHKVVKAVLFVTRQTPPHPKDTALWAPTLAKAITQLDSINLDQHPIEVATTTITDFTVKGFADAAQQQATNEIHTIVLPISSGAKASFVGLVLGTINAGALPLVVPIGRGETPSNLPTVVELDLVRWLTRRRMWSALATLPDTPPEVANAATELDRYERHERVTRADLPSEHLHRLIASTVSHWAANDPLWFTGLRGIVEKLTQRLVDQLPPTQRIALRKRADTWRRLDTTPPGDFHDADIIRRVAAHNPDRWKAWKAAPPELRTWIDSNIDLPRANRARHGMLANTQQQNRRDHSREYRTLAAISQGRQPALSQRVRDPLPDLALHYLNAGLPDTPLPGARLAVRLVGQRNASGVIDHQIAQHHSSQAREGTSSLPVVAIASAETAVDNAILIESNLLEEAAAIALTELRQRSTELELLHHCRITTLALYLNQGTKVMNFAAIRSALTVASELGAALELYDVAGTFDGDSIITQFPTSDVKSLIRKALPQGNIRALLRSALYTLDLVQAETLTALLDDPTLTANVEALAHDMLRPVDGIAENDWATRIEAIAPAVNALLRLRNQSIIGDRETVARLAQLLSAAVATKVDEGWNLSRGPLHDLWKARNAVFHDKRVSYPTTLTRGCLLELAQSLGIGVNDSAMLWNRAIDQRKELLKQLEVPANT